VLVVGDGIELGAYVGAISAAPGQRVEVVGVVMPHPGYRTNTVGGVPILGGLTDAPEIVRALKVTRIIVLGAKDDRSALDYLRLESSLEDHRISSIDMLGPLRDCSMDPWDDSAPGTPPRIGRMEHARPASVSPQPYAAVLRVEQSSPSD
jgi:hypothetical protein